MPYDYIEEYQKQDDSMIYKFLAGALKENNDILPEIEDKQPYLYRATDMPDGSIPYVQEKLIGASAAVNQLIQNGNFESTTGWAPSTYYRATTSFTVNNNKAVVVGAETTNGGLELSHSLKNIIANHKYLLSSIIKATVKAGLAYVLEKTVYTTQISGAKQGSCAANVATNFINIVSANNTTDMSFRITSAGITNGGTFEVSNVIIVDLTQMFGTAIADLAYSKEQASAGSGIAWLKSYGFFTKDYYPYNTGALQSVKTGSKKVIGKNLFDPNYFDDRSSIYQINSDNSITVLAADGLLWTAFRSYSLTAGTYTLSWTTQRTGDLRVKLSDDDYTYEYRPAAYKGSYTFTLERDGGIKLKLGLNVTVSYDYTEHLQLELGSTATSYESYTSTTYSLDSNLELRGLYKLDASNNIVCDGDEYTPDGSVKRRYGIKTSGFSRGTLDSSGKLYACGTISGAKNVDINDINMITNKGLIIGDLSTCRQSTSPSASIYSSMLYIGGYVGNESALDTLLESLSVVYTLSTSTTDSAASYQNPQIIHENGTEEFIDTRDYPLPVGHDTGYFTASDEKFFLPPVVDNDGRFLYHDGDGFQFKNFDQVASKAEESDINGNIKINGTETQVYDDSEIKGELSTDTTTIAGNPLNFTTLSAQKSKSTIIDIEPIQDLHGYDKPWVGGAGKNKCILTAAELKARNTLGTWTGNSYLYRDVTWTILIDNDNNVIGIKANGTVPSSSPLSIFYIVTPDTNSELLNGTYICNGCPTGGSHSTYSIRLGKGSGDSYLANDFGSGVTFSASNEIVTVRFHIEPGNTVNNLIFYPMLRLSTETDATFQPYTNIASISGRSEIGILGEGKNKFDGTFLQGYWSGDNGNFYSASTWIATNKIPCEGDTNYVYSSDTYTTRWQSFLWYDGNGDYISQSDINQLRLVGYTAKSPANARYVAIDIAGPTDQTTIIPSDITHFQLELGSTATSYSPYTKSTDLTINLGQAVYGGTLDVEKGELVVDKKYKLYDGSSDEEWAYSSGWSKTNTNVFFSDIAIEDAYFPFYDVVSITNCNYFEGVSRNRLYEIDTNGVSLSGTTSQGKITVRISKSTASSLEDFETWIASNNIEIVYILNTPITIQLTPNKISLLEGVNNISTAGDKITLTYRNGSVATLADLLDLEKKLTDEEPYGFIEHMSILDPAQRIEYIGKNKNYSPMTINLAGDHLANYNEWYDFPVIKENKPYMIKADGTVDYALDPNDYTKKFDGSASDVANTSYTGGAFAWIPKTYKREFIVGDDRYVYISTKKLSDEYEAIGFIDENGLEHDGAWIPMFYGTEITQDGIVKIMTLATGAPTQNRNTDTQKTYLTNANPDTLFFGGAIVKVLTDIMIMLGKNSDVQAVFGTGNMSGGNGAQYMKDNACIDGGAFYGTTTNNVLNKAFHSLVLLTQNQYQRDPYSLNIKGEYIVSPYYKYDLTGDSYVKTGVFVTPPSSNNWVYPHKSVSVPHWGAEPVGPYSGSTTTGWADGQYTLANQLTDTTVRVVLRFADCSSGRTGGLRAVLLNYAASSAAWSLGASPLLLSKGAAPQ